MKELLLTPDGYAKLKDEIEYLSTDKRREVAERIKTAREFGDIAENSEYDDAKNEQAMIEHRISQLEERLKSSRVIQAQDVSTDAVTVGTKVRLRDIGANKTVEYFIVGSAEANPAEHKLSNESPVGRAIIGHKEGRNGRGLGSARVYEVQDHGHQGRLGGARLNRQREPRVGAAGSVILRLRPAAMSAGDHLADR